jgi:hypothetical protein
MTSLPCVTLVYVPQRLNAWLGFGRPMLEDATENDCRYVYFAPGVVFGRMIWETDADDRVRAQFAVLRAIELGERVVRLDGVAPGARLLLHATTPAKAQVTDLIDAIETQHIALEEVGEDYWCVVPQRLVAGIAPPPYSAAEHAAVLQ